MTIGQVQPLNIPTASELTEARDFLFEADVVCSRRKITFLRHR